MCSYCEHSREFFSIDRILPLSWGWGDVRISLSEVVSRTESLFIDRGHLRLVDTEDSQCLEGGVGVPISYCPMCGRKL